MNSRRLSSTGLLFRGGLLPATLVAARTPMPPLIIALGLAPLATAKVQNNGKAPKR
jgi:hypothetical protein